MRQHFLLFSHQVLEGYYTIPNGVVEITAFAFSALGEQCIFIPASVEKIGFCAFKGRDQVDPLLLIPDTVKEINEDFFVDYSKVVCFSPAMDSTGLGSRIDLGYHLFDFKNNNICDGWIAQDVDWIGSWYCDDSINEKDKYMICFVGEGLLTIGWEKDLYDNWCGNDIQRDDIDTIIFKATDIEIGVSAFAGFPSLRNVVILGGVQKIGRWAFYGCPNLRNIQIHSEVKEIGAQAFQGAEHLFYFGSAKSVDNWGAKSLN